MKVKQLSLLALILGCAISLPVFAGEIAIPGTGDGVAILEAIGQAFTRETGTIVLVPNSIGSSGGIKVVGTDKAMLARVARKIKDKEKDYGLTYMPFVKVPTVFFVHNNVSVQDLTDKQVVDIFSGKLTNWQEVGGANAEIKVIRREDEDSSYDNLKKTFPGFDTLVFSASAKMAGKTPLMVANIENVANSIGFGPLDVAMANNLKFLRINGKAPVDDGYPSSGTIAFVYKEINYTGDIKTFVEFAKADSTHAVIEKAGGIPID